LRPNSAEVRNDLAWLLATNPDPHVRNGAEAMQLAQGACAVKPDSFSFLDTLGAAYAEAGRFAEAVATVQKAIALAQTAGQTNAAARFRTRLELYLHHRPCRTS
jgi:serine/threonine-protein kinase